MAKKFYVSNEYDVIHQQVLSYLKIKEKANKDNNIAKEMQSVLMKIKLITLDKDNAIDGKLQNEMEKLVQDAFNILNNKRQGKNKFTTINLFHRTHKTSTAYGGDDIFEEELAAFFTAIDVNMGLHLSLDNKLVGSDNANINHFVDNMTNSIMTKSIKNTIKQLHEETKVSMNKLYSDPTFKSGKVDVKGTSTIQIQANMNPEILKLQQLFSNKNFSVKNYSSLSNHLNIFLGDTNYYKAIYATLSALGYNRAYIDKVFYATLYKLKKHDTQYENVNNHFYHLRFIYELTGVGLYDKDGEPLSGVDFLIYNDPNSDNIFVKSTAQMILDELNKTHRFYGAVKIEKTYFK